MKNSRYKISKRVLIFWTLFIGFGAVAGALWMIIDPSGKSMGMDGLLPYFQVLPFAETLFQDLTFSGWALLVVNGITNLTAATLLFRDKKLGIVLGGVFGITLMAWITIQFCILPSNFMSTIYFDFGIFQAIAGYATWVFRKQKEFHFDSADYQNVGTDKTKLVVYFSRMGYVKKVAHQIADKTGAELCEIVTTEKIDGTLGFLWCGRYGMHRRGMPIKMKEIDLSAYDEVTICSPIWVFSVCAPIRQFLKQSAGKIQNVNYVLVHFTNGNYQKVARQMDEMLGTTHKKLINVRCRMGDFKWITKDSKKSKNTNQYKGD